MASTAIPTFQDVISATRRLRGVARTTPIMESQFLNESIGGRLLVKAECLQQTGSFKIRGAYNKISQLDAATRKHGVVAFSSGNHAQGVAAAAAKLGAPATIVMPADAPATKLIHTKELGAKVVIYDRRKEDREAIAKRLADERGLTLIKPYDDRDIIAGQGTVGNELANQCLEIGANPDAVLVPCSGGGLVAGCALALAQKSPGTAIYTVEPEHYDDTARSLATGGRQRNDDKPHSICDALLVDTPGELTFEINHHLLTGGLTVTDDQVRDAMIAAYVHLKLVVEPGGAAALAAALSGVVDAHERILVVVISGGNVDPAMFSAVLEDR